MLCSMTTTQTPYPIDSLQAARDTVTAALVLASFTAAEQEALCRFYVDGQQPHGMSPAQFRELKRQARQRFEEMKS